MNMTYKKFKEFIIKYENINDLFNFYEYLIELYKKHHSLCIDQYQELLHLVDGKFTNYESEGYFLIQYSDEKKNLLIQDIRLPIK